MVHFFTDIPVRNSCKWVFPKIMVPSKSSILSNRVFHYKPSILGYLYFWKHPYKSSTFPPIPPSQREAAFRHVTQRVQELADALHEEQRKHRDALLDLDVRPLLTMRLMDKDVLQNLHEMQCFSFNHPKWNLVHQPNKITYTEDTQSRDDCYTKHAPNYVAPNVYPNF